MAFANRADENLSICNSDFNVHHLAAAIKPVVRVDAMRNVRRAIGWILGQERCLETVRTAAQGAALLGVFAFGLCHEKCVFVV